MWAIIPAAGSGTRIQPLAFSKELLPVGTRIDQKVERPRAVSEYLLERMLLAGVDRLLFVISPGKTDILSYYGAEFRLGSRIARIAYVVQDRPVGLCDAIFRAAPLIGEHDSVFLGLPDTVWFPADALCALDHDALSFALFPVERPALFDAVRTRDDTTIEEIEVKSPTPRSSWIWGACRMPGHVFRELCQLWLDREPRDEYLGTLVNAYLARGGRATGIRCGEEYVDVGTLNGYREALRILGLRTNNLHTSPPERSRD
jgi:dTDP-glucose pyrophosphorylase